MVKQSSESVKVWSYGLTPNTSSLVIESEQITLPRRKPLEEKDIQRILIMSRSGRSSQVIARELRVPCWATALILSLYG